MKKGKEKRIPFRKEIRVEGLSIVVSKNFSFDVAELKIAKKVTHD